MDKIAVLAKMVAKDGRRDEAVSALQALIEQAGSEEGTEVYVMHVSDADPNVIWFYELYRDGDSLAGHGASDVMKRVGGELRDVMSARPEITILRPLAGKGVSL